MSLLIFARTQNLSKFMNNNSTIRVFSFLQIGHITTHFVSLRVPTTDILHRGLSLLLIYRTLQEGVRRKEPTMKNRSGANKNPSRVRYP